MKKILLILILLYFSKSHGQTTEKPYYVTATTGAGYGLFLTDLNSEGLTKSGFNGFLRILWQPEHRLRLGLETGFIQFYTESLTNVDTNFGVTDIKTKLNSVPILFIFSMNIINGFEINVGSGLYILYSTVDSHNNKVTSTQLSSGFMISGSYYHPLNNSISLGGEVKWNFINKINDGSLSFNFIFKYAIFEY